MDATGPVADRQLDARQQRNAFPLGRLAQCLELCKVELVVIGDDAQPDLRFFQGFDVVAVVKVIIARVLELTVCAGVQMKVRANPLRPFCESNRTNLRTFE